MTPADLEEYDAMLAAARKEWARGPWDDEPNRVEWRAHGLPCLILRSDLGTLCGYAGVPAGHPLHGKDKQTVNDLVSVHGGVTLVGGCTGVVCHVPLPGEPEEVWWIGFDCAHAWDVNPRIEALRAESRLIDDSLNRTRPHEEVEYRPLGFVRGEVERLAEQLAAMVATP